MEPTAPLIKRTIIFVWNYLEWGGAQIYFLAIMKLAKAEWDIVVVLPKNSPPDMINFLEQVAVRYEFLELHIDNSSAPTLAQKVKRQLKRLRSEREVLAHLRKFDLRENILHIETAPWQSWALLAMLARRGANIFVTMHNFMPGASRLRETVWRARMQFVSRLPGMHIIASNHDTKNRMKGWVASEFWNRVTVAHTAVNPEQINAARLGRSESRELRRLHSIPEEKTVVLALGQFIDRKGRWVFLEAAAKLMRTDPTFFFVWVTPKSPNKLDSRRIESYGVGDSFKLILSKNIGPDRLDVLRFLNVADIFALPSFVEGLPIALLEAMSIGIASVSTNVFAIPEAVKHMKTGMLVDAGDSEQLAAAVLELKNNHELRELLAANGRTFVLHNFDEREAARKCLAAYSKCFADVS